jgi:hypothetical protein
LFSAFWSGKDAASMTITEFDSTVPTVVADPGVVLTATSPEIQGGDPESG